MTVIDRPWLFKDDDGSPRWPGPRPTEEFAAHDAGTERLMQTYEEMYRLQESDVVVPLLEDWKTRARMASPAEKQAYLEPLIQQVRRAPDKNAGV